MAFMKKLLLMLLMPMVAMGAPVKAPVYVDGAVTIVADEIFHLRKTEPNLVVIDVRRAEDYNNGHLEGAINIISTRITPQVLEEHIKTSPLKDKPVLFYCNGANCTRASKAVKVAVAAGYKKVFYYYGGVEDWVNAGYSLTNPKSVQN